MPLSRDELKRRLDLLEAEMPNLTAKYPERGDFISEFSGYADSITDEASETDDAWVWSEIDRILNKFGYHSVENELPPDE